MRKMVIALIALGLVVASTAFAGNLNNECFNYANGNLVKVPPNDGWATYSGATGDIQVVSNYVTGIVNTAAFEIGRAHV